MNAALELVQDVHAELGHRPQAFVCVMAAGSLFVAVVALAVVALGSLAILLGALGLIKEDAPPPPRQPSRYPIISPVTNY